MFRYLEKAHIYITKILNTFCISLVSALTLLIFLQVILRYVFKSPFSWAEEITGFLFKWIILLGAVLAFNEGSHFRVDFLVKKLNKKMLSIWNYVIKSLLILFLIIISYQSLILTIISKNQISPVLEIPMNLILFLMPVSFVLMSFFVIFSKGIEKEY